MALNKPSPLMFDRKFYVLSAKQTSVQTIAASTDTTVIFNSVSFEDGASAYNSSTGVFTAPFNGYYLFNMNLGYINVAVGSTSLFVWFNRDPGGDNEIVGGRQFRQTVSGETINQSALILLDAGEVVWPRTSQTSVNPRDLDVADSGERTTLDIYLVKAT